MMNRALLLLTVWLALGLELSVRTLLSLGGGGIAPSVSFCVLTLIAMFATPSGARWAAIGIGLVLDLLHVLPIADAGGEVRVVGPHVLAMLAGVQAVLAVRGITVRRNPLTLGFLAMVGAVTAQAVLVAVLSLRAWTFDDFAWSATTQVWTRLLGAVYTGVLGAVLGLALLPAAPRLGLQVGLPLTSGRGMRF